LLAPPAPRSRCVKTRLGRDLKEADFVTLPHEIIARFAGQPVEPASPAKRQADLDSWRAWVEEHPLG
jgi:hypothetical protein